MSRYVSRHTFDLQRGIDKISYRIACFIFFFQLRAYFQSLFYRHIQLCRNKLGNNVHISVRHVQNSAHISYSASCSHRTERNNLRHTLAAVFAHYIIDYLLAPRIRKINVKIRHTYTFRVKKPFKGKIVFKRVYICDFQTIGDETGRSWASSRSYGYTVIFCKPNKIPYDKVIIGISHTAYYGQLIFKTCFNFVWQYFSKPRGRPVIAKLPKIAFRRKTVRNLKIRQNRAAEGHLNVTHLRYFYGVFNRFGTAFKKPLHFLRRAQIKLIGFKAHSVLVLVALACLNTHKYILRSRVFPMYKMHIVCSNQRYSGLFWNPDKLPVYFYLRLNTVALKLKKIVSPAENAVKP